MNLLHADSFISMGQPGDVQLKRRAEGDLEITTAQKVLVKAGIEADGDISAPNIVSMRSDLDAFMKNNNDGGEDTRGYRRCLR